MEWETPDILHVDVCRRYPGSSTQEKSLLRWREEEVAEEGWIDFVGIRPNQDGSLADAIFAVSSTVNLSPGLGGLAGTLALSDQVIGSSISCAAELEASLRWRVEARRDACIEILRHSFGFGRQSLSGVEILPVYVDGQGAVGIVELVSRLRRMIAHWVGSRRMHGIDEENQFAA